MMSEIYKKYHNYRIVTRQYFPKGMNVREISDKILAIASTEKDQIIKILNDFDIAIQNAKGTMLLKDIN